MKITAFERLIQKYEVIFFDAYGVLNCADGIIPEARLALRRLQELRKPFYVLSNDSSSSVENLSKKYHDPDLGLLVSPEQIISSGLIAQHYLQKRYQNKSLNIVYVGQKTVECYLRGNKFALSSLGDTDLQAPADIFALMSVNGYEWQLTLNKALNYLRAHPKLKLLCPNPDLIFHAMPGQVGIAAGGLASMVEKLLGRKFMYFGKPEKAIYDFAFQQVKRFVGKVPRQKILMVGDGVGTDILGARKAGIDSALVLSGITTRGNIRAATGAYKAKPTYVCEHVGI